MFQFLCRFPFLSTFRLSNRTPKITRVLTLLMPFVVKPLSRNCYKLSSVVTFTFIQNFDQNFVFFTLNGACVKSNFQNLRYFRSPAWKTKSW